MTIERVQEAQEALDTAERRVKALTRELADARKVVEARRLTLREAILRTSTMPLFDGERPGDVKEDRH